MVGRVVGWFGVLGCALLVSCAPPSVVPRASVSSVFDAPTFFPEQTGLRWSYHFPNEELSVPPVVVEVLSPTRFNGLTLVTSRVLGRGYDITKLHSVGGDGVFLHKEVRPGVTITYDPPIRELPGVGDLRVGFSWGGETTASIVFHSNAVPSSFVLSYEYVVLQARNLVTPVGSFFAYQVNLTGRDESRSVSHNVHFAPFVGYVINADGSILTGTNVVGVSQ
jgi:hypothetical protein